MFFCYKNKKKYASKKSLSISSFSSTQKVHRITTEIPLSITMATITPRLIVPNRTFGGKIKVRFHFSSERIAW